MPEKFGQYAGAEYNRRFVEPQKWFYNTMVRQLAMLPRISTILDVGSGPGSLAKLAHESVPPTQKVTILGVEPSELARDGEALAEELEKAQSHISYKPRKGSIEESGRLHSLTPECLDGIVLMRSAHEIAISRGYERFCQDMRRLIAYLKRGGLAIIGDPTYRRDIMLNKSEVYAEELKLAQEIGKERYGHSHTTDEFILADTQVKMLRNQGCDDLIFLDTMPQFDLITEMQNRGLNVERSPVEMYILTARKR